MIAAVHAWHACRAPNVPRRAYMRWLRRTAAAGGAASGMPRTEYKLQVGMPHEQAAAPPYLRAC